MVRYGPSSEPGVRKARQCREIAGEQVAHRRPCSEPDWSRRVTAITELKAALEADRPLSLVQMVPGSGNTFVAVMQVYRLLKYARARRALCFLTIPANLESLRS